MADYTWLDYIIFLIFFVAIIMGLARGIMRELISLVVIAVALVITIKFTMSLTYFLYFTKGSYDVIVFITKYISPGDWGKYIAVFTLDLSILLLFVGTMSIGEAVNYYVYPNTIMGSAFSLLYRISGSAVGFIRGYIFNVILILVLSITPVAHWHAWTSSYFVPRLKGAADKLGALIEPAGFAKFIETGGHRFPES